MSSWPGTLRLGATLEHTLHQHIRVRTPRHQHVSHSQHRRISPFVQETTAALGDFTMWKVESIPRTERVTLCVLDTTRVNARRRAKGNGAHTSGTQFTSATGAWAVTHQSDAPTQRCPLLPSSRARARTPEKDVGRKAEARAGPSTD